MTRPRQLRMPVFVEDWQIDCCGIRGPNWITGAHVQGSERWTDDGVLVDLVVREPADTPSREGR